MTWALAPAMGGAGSIEGTEEETSDESGDDDAVTVLVSTCIVTVAQEGSATADETVMRL